MVLWLFVAVYQHSGKFSGLSNIFRKKGVRGSYISRVMRKLFFLISAFLLVAAFIALSASTASAHKGPSKRGDPNYLNSNCVDAGSTIYTKDQVEGTARDVGKEPSEHGWAQHTNPEAILTTQRDHFHKRSKPVYECAVNSLTSNPLVATVVRLFGAGLVMVGVYKLLSGFLMSSGGGGGFGRQSGSKGGAFGMIIFGAMFVAFDILFIPFALWLIRAGTTLIESALGWF